MLDLQHQHNKSTTPPHMRVKPTLMWWGIVFLLWWCSAWIKSLKNLEDVYPLFELLGLILDLGFRCEVEARSLLPTISQRLSPWSFVVPMGMLQHSLMQPMACHDTKDSQRPAIACQWHPQKQPMKCHQAHQGRPWLVTN
jgi:hypothetical protein